MKIRVERDKIIKAVKKLDGIEIVLENPSDAKEAINLIIRKIDLSRHDIIDKLKDIVVTATQEYKTSAVDYNIVFTLEFLFEDGVDLDMKVSFIRELQEFSVSSDLTPPVVFSHPSLGKVSHAPDIGYVQKPSHCEDRYAVISRPRELFASVRSFIVSDVPYL